MTAIDLEILEMENKIGVIDPSHPPRSGNKSPIPVEVSVKNTKTAGALTAISCRHRNVIFCE